MNWKNHERNVAKTIGDFLGIQIRRNDARVNANDPARNSDVDVIHDSVTTPVTEGITIECKYDKDGFGSIYKWFKEIDIHATRILIINNQFIVFHINDFLSVWKALTKEPRSLLQFNIKHVTTSVAYTGLTKATNQANRYAHTKNLFPMLSIRKGGQQALMIINVEDLTEITVGGKYDSV